MKLKDIFDKFKKVIKREGSKKGNKEEFVTILKNIAKVEQDPVNDATVLVLKYMFQLRTTIE